MKFRATLTHQNEAAKLEAPDAQAVFTATLAMRTRLPTWHLEYSGLTTEIVEAHIHRAQGGYDTGTGVPLCPRPRGPVCPSGVAGQAKLQQWMVKALLKRQVFVDVHTHRFVAGELSGRLTIVR